ncbi:ATP-dependent DEAD/H RNA helicase, putative [Trypanosoma equiperdum]|uniref:ATP-dependent RNA helicase n=1 Tax=Trypanosoma equiperdum TaxID=5694 RepID=A0A1G4IA91_TRYEQ|nr:ATP-dependent DEAD/H RNA helicase, putative [Trypanosoma equiperdum]
MLSPWNDCVGDDHQWILKPLQNRLRYERPLPVQQAVVPTVRRALLSGLPMDVCLTAPTGSGKTLCYLLPLLQMITEAKKGTNHTRLLALVLVPTKALGQQVTHELQRLTRGTTITTVSLCDEMSVKEEAAALVRTVRLVGSGTHQTQGHYRNVPYMNIYNGDSVSLPSNAAGVAHNEDESEDGASSSDGGNGEEVGYDSMVDSSLHYYSRADIVISTPQRLLRHLDGTPGFTLLHLRLLVIDEADQVLSGNFANFVAKVVERFEEEQASRVGSTGDRRRLTQLTYSLHKFLCSATLSSHITRISEVRLRNCRHFTLDSFGTEIQREDEGEPLPLPSTDDTGSRKKNKRDQERGNANTKNKRGDDVGKGGEEDSCEDGNEEVKLPLSRQQLVRTSFALPPRLQEHVVFVEDWYRHAVLLKLVRAIVDKQKKAEALVEEHKRREEGLAAQDDESEGTGLGSNGYGTFSRENVRECESTEFRALPHRRRGASKLVGASDPSYPSCDDDAGRRIVIFCRSADEARVMGHFLLSAGVQATEFTTLATESERRRALLKSRPDSCVVASDALMRGVDVPNVGHVIMYNPPETLSQYVHRAGRTARAMRAGHLHLLLQKLGPSGTMKDGEVAMFKAISAAVSRMQPVRYERHFFMFDVAPTQLGKVAIESSPEGGNNGEGRGLVKDKARLLIEEADRYLKETQLRLTGRWVSALESARRGDAVGNKPSSATFGGSRRFISQTKRERG